MVRTIAKNYKLPYYTLSPTYSICKNHGYISGESYRCPECGEPAEVYSRITGYYRPVQNWNEGKSQEYKNRVEYDMDAALYKSCKSDSVSDNVKTNINETNGGNITIRLDDDNEKDLVSSMYLFTTKTCPNCKIAKEYLQGISYEVIDAEENAGMAMKYNIMQAPTLVVIDQGVTKKYVNASNIKEFVEKQLVMMN